MINEIAFVGVPVTDIPRARAFYEGALGFTKATWSSDGPWIEYEIGGGIFGIGNYGESWKTGEGGTMVAFECDDLEGMVRRAEEGGAKIMMPITESPICRFTILKDPDGNAIMLHKRKEGNPK
jgi:predicted enzyme related to lactoylglutathione lyase